LIGTSKARWVFEFGSPDQHRHGVVVDGRYGRAQLTGSSGDSAGSCAKIKEAQSFKIALSV
jgi:hypothetical protein